MPRMRGSAISGKPFRRGSLDLDTKAPLKRIRSSVNLWFDKVFGDVHLSPCPLEQVLGDDRPPDRRGRGHDGSWRARPQWGTTTVHFCCSVCLRDPGGDRIPSRATPAWLSPSHSPKRAGQLCEELVASVFHGREPMTAKPPITSSK